MDRRRRAKVIVIVQVGGMGHCLEMRAKGQIQKTFKMEVPGAAASDRAYEIEK